MMPKEYPEASQLPIGGVCESAVVKFNENRYRGTLNFERTQLGGKAAEGPYDGQER